MITVTVEGKILTREQILKIKDMLAPLCPVPDNEQESYPDHREVEVIQL